MVAESQLWLTQLNN